MRYSKRYSLAKKIIHKYNCSKCPVYQRAVETDSHDWQYEKCSKLDCWKLSIEDYQENYKKVNRFFKNKYRLNKLESPEHIENIRALYHDEGMTIKQIAKIYKLQAPTMSKFMDKHGIKGERFRYIDWLRDMPEDVKGKSWQETRDDGLAAITDKECLWLENHQSELCEIS